MCEESKTNMAHEKINLQQQSIRAEIKQLNELLDDDTLSPEDREQILDVLDEYKTTLSNLEGKKQGNEIQFVSSDAFVEITSKMIDETFKAFFLYHIATHPQMVRMVKDVEENPLNIEEYQEYKKYIIMFLTEKFRSKQFEREFKEDHEQWVYTTGIKDPFSFENVIELRSELHPNVPSIDPDKLRELMKSLPYLPLEEVVFKFEAFSKVSSKQEKDRYEKRGVSLGGNYDMSMP